MQDRREGNVRALIERVLAARNDSITPEEQLPSKPSVAVVVAHPDDESVGLGGRLHHFGRAAFLYATDGAPADMKDASSLGFESRKAYAQARDAERRAAFQLAGIDDAPVHTLDYCDQNCVEHLVEVTQAVADFLRVHSANFVFTHPYEGGHPDHDSCAFAVRHACRLLEQSGMRPPVVIEMASYHSRNGIMSVSTFLQDDAPGIVTIELDPTARARKRRLLECYRTQHRVFQYVNTRFERFRLAPQYAFDTPPHEGRLLYEIFGFSVTGRDWCMAAAEAERQLASAFGESSVELRRPVSQVKADSC